MIDGPTVVLCNGLGTNAYMWPALLDPDCGVRVVSWNHRGVGGSERPADKRHVEIEHFVEDGLSVMDHFGIGAGLTGAMDIYFHASRGTGRTTSLVDSVKEGDRVKRGVLATRSLASAILAASATPPSRRRRWWQSPSTFSSVSGSRARASPRRR